MSTRCNIIIKGSGTDSVTLYHHHDGYPSGVGAILKNLCKKLNEGYTYMECADTATYLVKYGLSLHNTVTDKTEKDDKYEISLGTHGDAEYLYVLYARPYASHGAKRYSVVGYKANNYWRGCDGWAKVNIPDIESWEVTFNK